MGFAPKENKRVAAGGGGGVEGDSVSRFYQRTVGWRSGESVRLPPMWPGPDSGSVP